MATVITEECINCGACEPECPNTAIYQSGVEYESQGSAHAALSSDFFYIVPEKCTECVGFFDHEACAAVCPVDCCVPDPARVESEDVLLDRARVLHPDESFGADFPSRFKKDGASSVPAVATEAPAAESATTAVAAPVAPAPPGVASAAPAAPPATVEDHEVPISCESCATVYAVAYRYLRPGTVLRCPLCQTSFSPTQRLYLAVGKRLQEFADAINAETDRHEDLMATEGRRFQANTERLRQAVDGDLAELTEVLTQPRKRSLFG